MSKSKVIRKRLGKTLNGFTDNYTIVDLETTGFSPADDDIIEIGSLKIRNDEVIDEFSTLVRPEKMVNLIVQNLTGISNYDLVEAPELDDVIDDFINFIGDDIIVGHNIATFDAYFLYDNILKLRGIYFSNDLVDTLIMSRMFFNKFSSHKLSFLAEKLNINVPVSHRALADCYTTFELYKILKSNDSGKNGMFETLRNDNNFSIDSPRSKSDYLFEYKFDNTNPFFNKICVFTGDLEIMSRQKATELIEKMGGFCKNSVVNKTDYLIVGEYNEFSKFMMKGKKSSKLIAAEELIEKGREIKIINETEFIDIVESSQSIENCINCDTPFYQQGVCFIGSMSDLLRVDAINMLHILGATEKENVSRNSQYVVIGEYDASLESVKKNLKKIDELAEKGIQVTTLTPEQFKDMLFTYCDYSQIVSAQDILDKISSSLNGKYKKIVKLYLKESKNVYTFVQASAKETPWHPELSGKTMLKIGISDIVFSNYMKAVLNKLKIEYTVDSMDFYHIDIEKFMKLDNSILNEIIIEALVKAFEFETFSCCSKYKECESKMACCHDDVLYSYSCQRKAFLDNQRALRKKCGLPTTTELRYFDKEYNPHKIIQIKVEKAFTESYILKVYLDNGKTVNILSDYLLEMQKSDFVKTHQL